MLAQVLFRVLVTDRQWDARLRVRYPSHWMQVHCPITDTIVRVSDTVPAAETSRQGRAPTIVKCAEDSRILQMYANGFGRG